MKFWQSSNSSLTAHQLTVPDSLSFSTTGAGGATTTSGGGPLPPPSNAGAGATLAPKCLPTSTTGAGAGEPDDLGDGEEDVLGPVPGPPLTGAGAGTISA